MPGYQKRRKENDKFSRLKVFSTDKVCYRIVSAGHDPLSTNGSLLYHGRYNNGRFLVLYAATSEKVCSEEQKRKTTVNVKGAYKRAKLEVKLKKVIDLTDEKNLAVIDVKKEDLICDEWTITQHIANMAYQKGIEALIVPSATGKGENIVMFTENFTNSTSVKKIDEKEIRVS